MTDVAIRIFQLDLHREELMVEPSVRNCLLNVNVEPQVLNRDLENCQIRERFDASFTSTCATDVVIFVPPAAPTTSWTVPFWSTTIEGDIDDSGLFPALIKLATEGGMSKLLVMLGDEKSSISSFRIIPVLSDINPAPKLQARHLKWYICDTSCTVLEIDGARGRNRVSVGRQDRHVSGTVILRLNGLRPVVLRILPSTTDRDLFPDPRCVIRRSEILNQLNDL
jgi:hypothetical protein